MAISARKAPEREYNKEVIPPNKRDDNIHLKIVIIIAEGISTQKRANIVTILANPSLIPGIGTMRLSGIRRSIKDSTTARDINMLFKVSFFIESPLNDSCNTCSCFLI